MFRSLLNKGGRRKTRGFSLLEVVIGFLIMVSTAAIFFQAMHLFRRETTFYSEHFVASSLLERVIEQCYQETEINPYGIAALGLSDLDGKEYPFASPVTDAQTVFFAKPPIVANRVNVLHEMLNDNFMLNIQTQKKDGFYEIAPRFKWNAKYGAGNSESYCRVLTNSTQKQVLTSLQLSDEAVQQRVVERVFSKPGTTLGENLTSIGAQDLVMGLGHIYFSCFDLFASVTFQQRCITAESMETGFAPGSKEYEKCTQRHYEITRDVLHLMVCLQPKLELVKNNIAFIDSIPFRERLILEGHLQKASQYYMQLRRIMLTGVLKLAERYEQQINHAASQREQRAMVSQIFNLYRILYENRNFCAEVVKVSMPANLIEQKYKSFLTRMSTYFQDRDPAIERLASQERQFIDRSELQTRYFLPGFLFKLCSEIEKFKQLVIETV